MEADYAVIYNPIAGGSKKAATDIEYAKKCLDDLKLSYKLFETEHAVAVFTGVFKVYSK